MRMNDHFEPPDGKDTYAVNATTQLDLLHSHLQNAKLEVELYSRSQHLMNKAEIKGCKYIIGQRSIYEHFPQVIAVRLHTLQRGSCLWRPCEFGGEVHPF